mgnify:CR=1 FL=1
MHTSQNSDEILRLLLELAIALGIGVLIGLERQLSQRADRHGAGGIRTFALVAVLGFLVSLPGQSGTAWMEVAGFITLALLLGIRHLSQMQERRKGITTEVSLLITFILGMLIQLQYTVFAVAVALLMSFLLSIKPKLQNIVQQVTEDELFAIMKFLVASVLILPLLPNRTIDPWGVLNPSEVWTVVVLVLSLSFVGYALMKFWSAAQGILLTGFLGGLISSTVVAWIFSNKSRQDPQNSRTYALATLMAITIMYLRIFILTEIINGDVGLRLLPALALLCAVGAFTVYTLMKSHGDKAVSTPNLAAIGNPFNMGDAIKFAVVFCVILILVSVAHERFGNTGVYVVSVFSGLASVDAIVVSMARAGHDNFPMLTVVSAVLLAVFSNNLVKLVVGLMRGSAEYRRILSLGIGLMLAASAIWWFSGKW